MEGRFVLGVIRVIRGICAEALPCWRERLREELDHRFAEIPQRAADGASRGNDLGALNRGAGNDGLEPMFETFSEHRSALKHAPGERHGKCGALVDEELARERPDVER